jgi:hypothetical protein
VDVEKIIYFRDKEGDCMSTDENKELNVMETLLNDQSYHIEFNGFLTNHVKHAVIALNRLGALPQRIQEYYNTYVKCTTYGYGLEPVRSSEHTITQDNWHVYFLVSTAVLHPTASFSIRKKRNWG